MTAVPELIALELKTRLEKITAVNGYPFTVPKVERPNRKAYEHEGRNLTLLIVQGDEIPNEGLSHEGNPPAIAYDAIYNIHGIVKNSDRDSTADSTTENALASAIRKAVIDSNQNTWHQFDGNAIDAAFGQVAPFVTPEGDRRGITVPLIVTYRVSETDPETVRA